MAEGRVDGDLLSILLGSTVTASGDFHQKDADNDDDDDGGDDDTDSRSGGIGFESASPYPPLPPPPHHSHVHSLLPPPSPFSLSASLAVGADLHSLWHLVAQTPPITPESIHMQLFGTPQPPLLQLATPPGTTGLLTPQPTGRYSTPLGHFEEQPREKRKRTRGSKACDFCIRRKLRCVVPAGSETCGHCTDRTQRCVFSPRAPAGTAAAGKPSAIGQTGVFALDPRSPGAAVSSSSSSLSVWPLSPASASAPPTVRVPRLFTPFDDMPALPSTDVQHLLLLSSLQEPQTALPILHRASLASYSPLVKLALEAVASRFSFMPQDGFVLFERAKRLVVPVISGIDGLPTHECGLALDAPHFAANEHALQPLQALAYLIFYCLLDGRPAMQAMGQRWLAMGIACARQIKLNQGLPVNNWIARQSRIRLWWLLFLIDVLMSTASNSPPFVQIEECMDLPLAASETTWQRDLPTAEDPAPLWREVVSAFDESDVLYTSNLPLVLLPFWSRTIGILYLLRISNQNANRAWEPKVAKGDSLLALVPPIDHPLLLKSRAMLDLWKRSQDTFHAVGDGSVACGGAYEAADFIVLFYHSSCLLLHSPRSVIDRLVAAAAAAVAAAAGESPATISLDSELGAPLLRAWAASAHAAVCADHVQRMAAFLLDTLEGAIRPQDTRGAFYDRKITFLGILGWFVLHAGLVASLLERSAAAAAVGAAAPAAMSPPAPPAPPVADRMARACSVFLRAMAGMAKVWSGTGALMLLLASLRAQILAAPAAGESGGEVETL
ncbi:hypothetical protein DFJ73DRAFT_243063 [Zopfochytrium polystomum]|nr:hypothetical protein DFJ73DRAFT_243063 [Zopfochytrium polystomum]